MLQLFGLLIIVNTLICGAWSLQQGKPSAVGIYLIAFALVAGLALTFHERAIEISFGKYASIKAAAQQATTDAQEIAKVRERVEAQAATLDLVAKSSAEAKTLLDQLRTANTEADKKLNLLQEKTASIVRLPDGRTKIGTIITGLPSELQKQFDVTIESYKAQDFKTAYTHIQETIDTYEKSKEQEKGIAMSAGGLNPEAVPLMHTLAAELAQKNGDHANALKWAQKAVDEKPTPERKALLVTALINAKEQNKAQKLIEATLKEDNEDSRKFRSLLEEIGVLKKNP